MKNNIPLIYWTFRNAWTLLHFLIVAAAAVALFSWAREDDRAVRAFEPARDNVLEVQEHVASMVPWPWAAGGDNERDRSASSSSQGDASPPEDEAYSQSGTEYQVIGNVNVRVAPNVESEIVTTLSDGDWIMIDCVTDGSLVDPGPYETQLSMYSGIDNGSTVLWNHIPNLGYVSDAYVATESSGGVAPSCTE